MSRYLFFISCIVFFNCSSSNQTEDTAAIKDTLTTAAVNSDTLPVKEKVAPDIDWDAPDTLKIAKMKWYASTWDATYFPLPDERILKRYYLEDDAGYVYLAYNFDSLSARVITEHYEIRGADPDEEYLPEPCAWRQKFKSDITYSISTCTESGGGAQLIQTKCPDKKVLARLVDILFQDVENEWNQDSSRYDPIIEGPGCSYSIEKNEEGYYDISYYCGC